MVAGVPWMVTNAWISEERIAILKVSSFPFYVAPPAASSCALRQEYGKHCCVAQISLSRCDCSTAVPWFALSEEQHGLKICRDGSGIFLLDVVSLHILYYLIFLFLLLSLSSLELHALSSSLSNFCSKRL
jgi:hypothetical protein